MKKIKINNYLDYSRYYDQAAMWSKIRSVSKKAGSKVVYLVLLLFYAATDPKMPLSDKAKIYGAIGYFILPVDLIPDFTPLLGFSDDLAALVWAFKAVVGNITQETRDKAASKLKEWFDCEAPDDHEIEEADSGEPLSNE